MQALYKAWFVDFEPFGGVRPSSWNDTNIYAIANIIYGAPFASKLFNTDGLGKPIILLTMILNQLLLWELLVPVMIIILKRTIY